MAHYAGVGITLAVLASLFVALIPTTIGALLSAIGIAGMNRLVRKNVLATSGRAVEAAGDVSVLLLDKTGTITLGNRQAARFLPVAGRRRARAGRGRAALVAGRRDPRGPLDRGPRERALRHPRAPVRRAWRPLHPLHGRDPHERRRPRRLAACARVRPTPSAVRCRTQGGDWPASIDPIVDEIARGGATPLVVVDGTRTLGAIELKDVVKEGIRERFAELRAAGIRTVMITGDNPLTAAAIAAEAGLDDFLAEATPEAKLALIREQQAGGRLVAMTGDGTNDAPALAQADVGVAMNAGTTAAKEAGNMVDLDSNPTKLLDVVEIGKQMLITRGALTTFSIANDLAKFFAIVPAIFLTAYPQLDALNILQLRTPESAILSAVIFNALIIVALIPVALRGVRYRPTTRRGTAAPQRPDLRRRRRHRPLRRHQDHRYPPLRRGVLTWFATSAGPSSRCSCSPCSSAVSSRSRSGRSRRSPSTTARTAR